MASPQGRSSTRLQRRARHERVTTDCTVARWSPRAPCAGADTAAVSPSRCACPRCRQCASCAVAARGSLCISACLDTREAARLALAMVGQLPSAARLPDEMGEHQTQQEAPKDPQPPVRHVAHGAAGSLISARADPPRVIAWLAVAGNEQRAAAVRSMQSTAGNRAVTRFLRDAATSTLARRTGTAPVTVPGMGTGTGPTPLPQSGPSQRYAPPRGSGDAFEQSWREFWSFRRHSHAASHPGAGPGKAAVRLRDAAVAEYR